MEALLNLHSRQGRRLRRSDFDWFDLEKYREVERFSLYEWLIAFNLRVHADQMPADDLQMVIENPMRTDYSDKEWAGEEGAYFESINYSPPPPLIEDADVWASVVPLIGAMANPSDLFFQFAKEISQLAGSLRAIANADSGDEWNCLEEADPRLQRSIRQLMFELSGSSWDYELLTVSLSASDEDLIEAFKSWLARVRAEEPPQEDIPGWSPAAVRTWIDFKVLAYMDIALYCHRIAKGNCTQALTGELLFPNEEVDTTERVRKVTRPMAQRVLGQHFLAELASYLAKPEAKGR